MIYRTHKAVFYNFLFILTIIALTAVRCGKNQNIDKELSVGAAANLQFALKEAIELYPEEKRSSVIFSWGSSGNLRHQIENGAPFDLYFSANEAFMYELVESGFCEPGDVFPFVNGQIAIGVQSSIKCPVEDLGHLLNPEIKQVAIATPLHAPYGISARSALIRAGIWDEIQPKLIVAETIRQCLQFIETGNADAGIISANVPEVENVRIIPVDPTAYDPPRQMVGILKRSEKKEEAREFLGFLSRPECAKIFEKYKYQFILDINK